VTTAGVGFSTTSNISELVIGDEQTALDNYRVLQVFYEKFPHLRNNDLHLASESYGGQLK